MKNKLLVIFFAFTLITTLGAPQPAHAGGLADGLVSMFTGVLDIAGNLINNTISIISGVVQGTINLIVGGSFSEGYKQGFCNLGGGGYGILNGGDCDNPVELLGQYWEIDSSSGLNGTITPIGTTIVEQGKSVVYKAVSGPFVKIPLALPAGCIEAMIPTRSKISNALLSLLGVKSAVAATNLFGIMDGGVNCTQRYKVIHEAGWVVASVTVDGENLVVPQDSTTFSYTFESVSANHTISATFALASTPPIVVADPPAVCGTANGVAVSDTPSSGLCSTGTASSVSYLCEEDPDDGTCTGVYYYAWNCSGSGLTTAYCTAPYTAPPVTPTCSSTGPGTATAAVSGTYSVYAYGVSSNVTSVSFPTWGDTGGQNDIVYYAGVNQGGGTWRADIDMANHKAGNPEYGNINVHVYMAVPGITPDTWCGAANFTRTATVSSGSITINSMGPTQANGTCTANVSWGSTDAPLAGFGPYPGVWKGQTSGDNLTTDYWATTTTGVDFKVYLDYPKQLATKDSAILASKTSPVCDPLPTNILAVATYGTGTGKVTGSGITCTRPSDTVNDICTKSYVSNTSVTLTATPTSGNSVSWTGCDSTNTSDNTCTVTMNAAKSVTATFTPGALSYSCTGTQPGGTTLCNNKISGFASDPGSYGDVTSLANCSLPGITPGYCKYYTTSPLCPGTPATTGNQTVVAKNHGPGYVTGGGFATPFTSNSNLQDIAVFLGATEGQTVTLYITKVGYNVNTFLGDTRNGVTTGYQNGCYAAMDVSLIVSYNTLSVATYGTGTGAVTGSGITCTRPSAGGDICSLSFVSGTPVTLTASPTSGSTFAGWSGACTNAIGTCTVTMDAAKAVTATFNVASSMSGSLSVITSSPCVINVYESTCNVNLSWTVTNPEGKSTITSSNPSGLDYNGASDPPSFYTTMPVVGEHNPTSFYLYNNSKLIAQKDVVVVCVDGTLWNNSYCAPTAPTTYTLSVATYGTGTGKVTGSGITCTRPSDTVNDICTKSYVSNTSVTLTATPTSGNSVSWTGCDSTNTSDNTCTVSMSGAKSVLATFAMISTPVIGICGSVNGTTVSSLSSSSANLCSPVTPTVTSGSFSGTGPWSWTCDGVNGGGKSPLCTATKGCVPSCSPTTASTICSDQSFSDGCGGTCTGTRVCGSSWKEVAP